MSSTTSWRLPSAAPQERRGWPLAGLTLLTIGVYYAWWLYRLHRETPARVGKDPSNSFSFASPFLVAVISIAVVGKSGAFGIEEVDYALFWGGMGINFVSHLLFLWVSLRLSDRLAGLAEACGIHSKILKSGKRDVVIGVFSIAFENIGLKSASLLQWELPGWLAALDLPLLILGIAGMVSWSRHCLFIANSFAVNQEEAHEALGLGE